jgi:hypothetical protein
VFGSELLSQAVVGRTPGNKNNTAQIIRLKKQFQARRMNINADDVVTICRLTFNFFVYSLFNNAFSISDYTASNERIIVINELERMWKEAVMA